MSEHFTRYGKGCVSHTTERESTEQPPDTMLLKANQRKYGGECPCVHLCVPHTAANVACVLLRLNALQTIYNGVNMCVHVCVRRPGGEQTFFDRCAYMYTYYIANMSSIQARIYAYATAPTTNSHDEHELIPGRGLSGIGDGHTAPRYATFTTVFIA